MRSLPRQKKYQDLINAKDLELEKTKREIKRLAEEKSELTMRIENLDKYVGDLPTSDEFRKLRNKSKHWKHLCCKLQEQIKENEEKFTSGRKDLEEKALNADRFERENFDLRRMVKSLQDKMKNDDAHSKALELEHVMFENERLQADIEKMEKLINEKQRKQKQFYLQSQESQKKLEQRLSQEEDTVAALREEISKKELNISELKSSMKQLSSQCQNLVEEKLDINDKLKKMQIINTKETVETNRKIYKQLRRNVNKLKDIMRLYQQRKEGRDLELSLLLGTAGAGDSLRNHDEQLLTEEVNELSKDIDEFQTFLTDQYAEELANNLEGNCTMQ
ncbi:centrosomal protein of 85 kDa-like isoform X2 [Xenia sp. Carnegie-2017]|uniref:centrosomal protein of 85 kDa-like isoform X2 n=1 Tax=Xenia sp. Carnegie-2017 TaxID=2897299 RepID=UPI001F0484AB|nr:centrosomal protein of 85 kDa-like isoform X2 [Xenia sp. Carnegie-2017]